MPDRIDPGPGWRLLEIGEIRPKSYEAFSDGKWRRGVLSGMRICPGSSLCRVRVTPRATKAVATRATVRAAFPDGAMISDSIACETGLSEEMMAHVSERWSLASKHLSTSGAKYVMLEIQREGEP